MSKTTERQEPKSLCWRSWSDSGDEDDEKVKDETCIVAHASSEICLGVDLEPDEWIKDSGCSKHMMGNRKLFSTYKAYNGGNIIFGSNLRGNIIGKGQICDNKCRVTFSEYDSEITKDGKVIEMLKKFGLEESKPMKTPMSSDTKLTKDEECESVDSTKYRGMIGECVFTDRWRLDELVYGIPLDGPYQTNPPSIEDIFLSIRINREGQIHRIRHEEEIDVLDYQILTCEIIPTLKPLEEIIGEIIFCIGGYRDNVSRVSLFFFSMLYCGITLLS
ncbi:hypothetical protein Tco_0864571 [Tanacetum coccineum]